MLLKSDHMFGMQLGVMFDIAASQPMKQMEIPFSLISQVLSSAFGHGGIGDLTLYLSVQ